MWKKTKTEPVPTGKDNGLFTLDVFLLCGDISNEFLKKNKVISRTIEILGNQTLEDLHNCIFEAFDRFDGHLYEFQFGGKGPYDPKAKRYVLPAVKDKKAAGDLTRTKIGSLGLKVGDIFGYVFDYGDNWLHQIDVLAVSESFPAQKYPRITNRVGQSPPQYRDCDDDEDWDDDEFEDNDDIYSGQEITVPLTAAQHDLLLSLKKKMDADIARCIGDGKKIGDFYEIVMTDEQIDRLLDTTYAVMNKEKDQKRHTDLDQLSDYLIDILETGAFQSDETEHGRDSDIPVIDLTCFSCPPIDIEPEALNLLRTMADEVVQLCRISGISLDKFLESQKPRLIKPNEKVDLPLTSQQKELLLNLPSLKADVAAQIKWAQEKRDVKLTLSQINALENTVAISIQQTDDKKTRHQLSMIDQKLIAAQMQYTDKDDATLQKSPFLNPDQLSRGEIIRNLMTSMINEHKDKNGRLGKKKK